MTKKQKWTRVRVNNPRGAYPSAMMGIQYLYVQGDKDVAAGVLDKRFGVDPHRTLCTCCGPDYDFTDWSIRDGIPHADGVTLVIPADDLTSGERSYKRPE